MWSSYDSSIHFFSSILKPFIFPIHFYFTELVLTRSVLLHVSSTMQIWFIDQLFFGVPIKFYLYSFCHCEYSFVVVISTTSHFLTSNLPV